MGQEGTEKTPDRPAEVNESSGNDEVYLRHYILLKHTSGSHRRSGYVN